MAKHDWNSLPDYLSIHDKTIRFYHKFMESPKVYSKKVLTDFEMRLKCDGIIVMREDHQEDQAPWLNSSRAAK